MSAAAKFATQLAADSPTQYGPSRPWMTPKVRRPIRTHTALESTCQRVPLLLGVMSQEGDVQLIELPTGYGRGRLGA